MPRVFFLFADGDLNVEESLAKAEGFMEPVDVDRGVYEVVYDETGTVYSPFVDGTNTRLLPTNEANYDDLVSRLRAFLTRTGLELPGDGPDFPLAAARQVAQWSWDRRWPKRGWIAHRTHGSGPPSFDVG